MTGVRRFQFPGESHLLDINEVATYLGLTRQAVYQRRYRGDFPAAIKVGASLRWHLSDIRTWVETNKEVV